MQAFIAACRTNNMQYVQILLNTGQDLNEQDDCEYSGLHYAAELGNLEVVEFLIMRGASIALRTRHDHTPLMLAVRNGHGNVVDFLIKQHAEIDAKTRHNCTALSYAPAGNVGDFPRANIIKLLLEHNADPDNMDIWGNTPRMLISYRGYLVKPLFDAIPVGSRSKATKGSPR